MLTFQIVTNSTVYGYVTIRIGKFHQFSKWFYVCNKFQIVTLLETSLPKFKIVPLKLIENPDTRYPKSRVRFLKTGLQ